MHIARLILALLMLATPAGLTSAMAETPATQAPSANLDILFAKLHDPAIGSDAMRIEKQIWDLWLHQGTDAQNESLAKATLAMNLADFATAETMLTELISKNPNFAEAYNKRATLYFIMTRYEASLSDIVKTLDLEPRHFGALAGRGMIYQRLGRDREALAAFKDALAVNPNMTGAGMAVKALEKKSPEL